MFDLEGVEDVCPWLSGYKELVGNPKSFGLHFEPCLEYQCKLWNRHLGDCYLNAQRHVLQHRHDYHLHSVRHSVDQFEGGQDNPGQNPPDTGDTAQQGGNTSEALLLKSEFFQQQDLNRDGKIYGKHFQIDPNDPNIPFSLIGISTHPNNRATETMTWSEYLESS